MAIQNVGDIFNKIMYLQYIIYKFVDVDQSLYYLIDTTRQRMMVIDNLDTTAIQEIRKMRPIPNNIAIIGNKTSISLLLTKVSIDIMY